MLEPVFCYGMEKCSDTTEEYRLWKVDTFLSVDVTGTIKVQTHQELLTKPLITHGYLQFAGFKTARGIKRYDQSRGCAPFGQSLVEPEGE